MVYTGTVINRVVVPDSGTKLPEGQKVRMEMVLAKPATVHFEDVGEWDGPPGEADRLIADLQAMRDAEIDVDRS